MMESSMYLSHLVGLSGDAFCSHLTALYIFAITGVKGDPIAKRSSCQYISEPNWKDVHTQTVNISIYWDPCALT